MQASSRENVSILKTVQKMWHHGGITSFFRGAVPPVTGRFFITAMFFTLNGYIKDTLISQKRLQDPIKYPANTRVILPISQVFIIGATCGVILAPIISPIELVKVQLQLDQVLAHSPSNNNTNNNINSIGRTASKYPAREATVSGFQSAARKADLMFGIFNLGGHPSSHATAIDPSIGKRYTGVFDCFATAMKRGALTRGMSMCIMRLVPGWGVYVLTYESWNRMFDNQNTMGNNRPLSSFSGTLRVVVGGSLAGITAWTTSYPFDYVKTKMQAHPIEKWNIFHTYKRATHALSVRDVVVETYHLYGLKGFYRGFLPCLYRSVPVNLTQFWVYESVFQILQNRF